MNILISVISFVLFIISMFLSVSQYRKSRKTSDLVYVSIACTSALLIIYSIYMPTFKPAFRLKDNAISMFLIGCILLILVQEIAFLFKMKVLKKTKEEINEDTHKIYKIIKDYKIYGVVPTVLAPVSEEILYRYFILSTLVSLIGTPIACILTSLLFACMHGAKNAIYLFLIGLILSTVFILSGNILVSVLCHIVMNIYVLIRFH